MNTDNQIRTMIVLWCFAGMLVSYVCGYELMYRDLQEAEDVSEVYWRSVVDLKARNEELQKRSQDRDVIEQDLRGCYKARHSDLNQLENIRWQMETVIRTCPGRTRPPRLPRN